MAQNQMLPRAKRLRQLHLQQPRPARLATVLRTLPQPQPDCRAGMPTNKKQMRKYFITGLLVLVPLAITLWVLHLIIGNMDQSLLLLPEKWRPEALFGAYIPGMGTILTLVIVFLTGLVARNFIGKKLVYAWELLVARIPVVSSIYSSVKQVSDTLFSSSGNAFRKALLVQYPREGSWTIAFLTGTSPPG